MADPKVMGVDELNAKFRQLPTRLGMNAMRRALRKGANVVRDAARANAKRIDDPNTPADISKNIAVSAGGKRREQRAGGPMMRVGVRGGARPRSGDSGLSGGNTTHWRFIEFGTERSAAQPFMRPAAESNVQAVVSAVIQDMPKQMQRELAKMKK